MTHDSRLTTQNLNRMRRPYPGSPCPEPRTDLHQASRIAGEHQVRCGVHGQDGIELGIEHRLRHSRFKQGEDARTAAALLAVGEREEGEAGHALEHRQRLCQDPLRMLEVAGGVIDGAER